eukprot:CAMPEP_0196656436 /NCGR_PEP_ID=MMETSP1086-20130531/17308_1 /TAXON_ID=77921 /ORGANISM="Cyanoptyche  gloeocystis , Strain SAG4.97" /LENGTH=127 /DNA_ID=CAMNT_0041989181 /DNA_START=40 /DNA_END=423 /DNA_ORIENTATION=+
MAASVAQRVVRALDIPNLAEKLKPQLVNGVWHGPKYPARAAARLRKETLLAGEVWPFEKAKKEVFNPPKGHKWERERHARLAKIAKNMEEMPKRIAEYRKNKPKRPPKRGSVQWALDLIYGKDRPRK